MWPLCENHSAIKACIMTWEKEQRETPARLRFSHKTYLDFANFDLACSRADF